MKDVITVIATAISHYCCHVITAGYHRVSLTADDTAALHNDEDDLLAAEPAPHYPLHVVPHVQLHVIAEAGLHTGHPACYSYCEVLMNIIMHGA